VTVGEVLTEARYQAGLSVDELSQRTRIRETVIRSIERDDYDACGGDLYVRGYVRAIAGAVGIDAQPLIREYDMIRAGGAAGNGSTQLAAHPTAPDATSLDLPPVPAGAAAATPLDLPPVPAGGADATSLDLPPVPAGADATSLDLPPVPAPGAGATPLDLPSVPAARAGATPLDVPPVAAPGADATSLDLPPVPAAGAGATSVDTAHAAAGEAATRLDLAPDPADPQDSAGPADPAETRFDLPPVTDDDLISLDALLSADPAATRFDLEPVWEPVLGSPDDPPPFHIAPSPDVDLMAAGYQVSPADGAPPASGAPPWPAPPWSPAARPAPPWPAARVNGGMQGPPASPRHGFAYGKNRHVPAMAAAAVALVLAVVGLLVVQLGSSGTPNGKLASTPGASSTAKAPSSAATASPANSPTQPAASLPPVASLPIAAAQAFGPDGLADGDNARVASNAIARNGSQPWITQWYATPDFGKLKKGTGLLLDLGHTVTITSVLFNLSTFKGVNLQLKAGNGTAPADLKVATTVTNSGGALRLTLPQPETARYLLIWFTLLPPNGQQGQFQESVADVLVNGRA